MPATTPTLGAPYPLDSDARAAGAGAIRDLAEWTEAELLERDAGTSGALGALNAEVDAMATSWTATAATSAPVQNLSANTPALATMGAVSQDPGGIFGTSDLQTFQYNGPTRLFLVTAHVTLTTGAVAGPVWTSTANLLANGAVVMGSRHSLSNPAVDTEDDFLANHAHSLTWIALLSNGDTMAVQVESSRTGTAINKGIAFAGFGKPL